MKPTRQLLKRSVILFPNAPYLNSADVRNARVGWIRSVGYLRMNALWILDKPVRRMQ